METNIEFKQTKELFSVVFFYLFRIPVKNIDLSERD